MRVLFVLQDLQLGGIQKVTSTIAGALNSEEYDVSLLVTRYSKAVYSSKCHVYQSKLNLKNLILDGTRHILKRIPWVSMETVSVNKLHQFLQKRSFDVIILNPEFFSETLKLKKFYPKTRILLWMHNNFDIYMYKYYAATKQELCQAAISADGIICLERYTFSKWKKFNKNCYLIHNPMTIDECNKHADLNSRKIAFVGRLEIEQKGLDYLLEIAKRIPDGWQISIAGSGKDEDKIKRMAKEQELLDKVDFRGALYGDDLSNHYLTSSIMILPSRWEGFALVTVEAMSRGLPIVAFDIPSMREATDEGKFGLLAENGNIASFAMALNSFIQSFEKRMEYSSLSLKRSKDFRMESVLETWKNMLIDINSR